MKMKIVAIPVSCIILSFICLTGCSKKGDRGNNPPPANLKSPLNPVTATAICDYNFNDTTLINAGWTKAFEDNFDGDLSKWSVLVGGVENELECNQASNITVSNGVLQIKAKKESTTGPVTVGSNLKKTFDYSSGWLTSKYSFAASDATPKIRIVVRLKIASGYGLTSIAYTYGGNGAEIDYIGAPGDNTKLYGTDYIYSTGSQSLVTGALLYNPTTEDLSACYHVYELEWSKQSLVSYLDGKLVETKTSGNHIPDLFGKTQFLSFNLPIGGLYYSNLDKSKIQLASFSIDYVKVFTSK